MLFSSIFLFSQVVFAERSVNNAVHWAEGQIGINQNTECNQTNPWAGYCARFVAHAYGNCTFGVDTAKIGWEGSDNVFGERHPNKDYNAIPKGALVFFNPDPEHVPEWHVGLAIGNGKMIHAYVNGVKGPVDISSISNYLGWRWPSAWTDDQSSSQVAYYPYFRAGNLAWFPPNVSCIKAERWRYFSLGYPNGGMSIGNSGICWEKETEVMQALGWGSDWWQILFGEGDIDQYKVCSK
jgi:hypothetical protein